MEERIELIIDGNGNIEIETHGFVGQACEQTVKQVLNGLGGTVVEERHKPEYYEDGDNPVEVLSKG